MKDKLSKYNCWITKAIKLYYKPTKVVILRVGYNPRSMSYPYICVLPDKTFTINVYSLIEFKEFNEVFQYIKYKIENCKHEVKKYL